MTSLPLIVAEEMDADWSKVSIEWAPTNPNLYGYGAPNARSMWIVGSRAVMVYYNQLRIAAPRCARCSYRTRRRSGASMHQRSGPSRAS